MKFNCSISTQQFLDSTHRLMGARNKSLLARAAILAALGEGVPASYRLTDSQGVDLDENIILGERLERGGPHRVGEARRPRARRAGLPGGVSPASGIWLPALEGALEQLGPEPESNLPALFDQAGEDFAPAAAPAVRPPCRWWRGPVKVRLLIDGEEWVINAAGQNALLVVTGKPGTGKSQLALDLLAQVARQGVRILFFDLKGELEDDPNNPRQRQNREAFLELTGAKSVRLIRQGLPINPLVRDANPTVNAQVAYEMASLIRAFAPQLGAKQERHIAEAFQKLEAPDFASLAGQLEKMGATGVELALVKKILALNLFAGAQTGVSPEEWLSSSLVIDFKEFHNDNHTKALAVALILNFLMKRLDRNLPVKDGIQPLKMVLFVDEAHLLAAAGGQDAGCWEPWPGRAARGGSRCGWLRRMPMRF